MASDCHCPNCEDYLGKDTEVDYFAYCGNCGHRFINLRGDRAYTPPNVEKWKSQKGTNRRAKSEIR